MRRTNKKKRHKHRGATGGVAVSREELVAMHAWLKGLRPRPGGEAYSLLAAAGACLGNWPRVTRKKADELRLRFRQLQSVGPAASPPSLGAKEPPPAAPPDPTPAAGPPPPLHVKEPPHRRTPRGEEGGDWVPLRVLVVRQERAKAVQVILGDGTIHWLPRSQCQGGDACRAGDRDFTLRVTAWVAREKGLA